MTVVERIIQSSHPSSLKVLQALASAVGINEPSIQFSEDAVSSEDDLYSVEMTIHTKSAFDNTETFFSTKGFTACARAICAIVPESGLWGHLGAGNEVKTIIEAWVETAVTTLLIPAFAVPDGKVKARQYESQVRDFISSIENHLEKSKFIVGNRVTSADIIISSLAHVAISRLNLTVPPRTGNLLNIILSHKLINNICVDMISTNTNTITPQPHQKVCEFAENDIVKKLDDLGISHNTYAHKLSTKVEELISNVQLPDNETHTKNIFFKDKKHGLFLVSVMPGTDVNTKQLGKALKLGGKTNFRFAEEGLLMSSLGVKPGCVGPMSIMNNTGKDVTLVLDERFFAGDLVKIHSHPLTNEASTSLSPSDLKSFFQAISVEPIILPFGKKKENPPIVNPAGANKKGGQQQQEQKNAERKVSKKGETLLALQWKKEEHFAMWYSDVIVLSEMISYYDISGCYILRPWSYTIWDLIRSWFNIEIAKLGVENAYFPLFVSQDRLEKEKDHVEGFAPEVAWVTKSGDGELAKPIAVRPTSETIMYPAFSDWIKSHRDLPLKLNQWSNVVRWEFKDPTPFLRSREFLWQEGHTAHTSFEDSQVMVRQALELYRKVYEELLAVPVVPGYKTEAEKFAGGHQTTTVEAYIAGSGRAIQGATSHNLGQNFGKMFDINFQDETGKSQIAWQTSWGLTTRSIGVMIMVHGDDKGLVLPPRISPLQAVIVPIISKSLSYADAKPYCDFLLKCLTDAGLRTKYDDREMYNPGWKYNHWEQKGVPIRVEVGPRDIEANQARIVTRYSGEKEDVGIEEIAGHLAKKLISIQQSMFKKALVARDQHLVHVKDWKDFVPNLERNNLVLTPWCGGDQQDWEEWVKEKSREESLATRGQDGEDARTATSVAAKTLCIPFDQPDLPEGTKCFASGKPATCWVLWGRSY